MTANTRRGRLTLTRLTKRYPGTTAVDSIDLEVGSGEFVTLLGPSGSGKTTTLMMVAGFTSPTSGEIAIDDRPITAMPPEHRNIGVVFQNYALFPHMRVFDNVAFPLRMRRQPASTIRSQVEHALDMVHLGGLGDRLPAQLSGGQQQRVALARALVFSPGLLLMDEPLGALDRNLREQMKTEIKRIHNDVGVTVLYVTHDQEEALTMSDRVALMNRGRIAQLGSAEDLYERPASRFVAEFIGESNLLEGHVESADGGLVFVGDGGVRVPVQTGSPGQRDTLMLRPEKISLAPASAAPHHEAPCASIAGEVEDVVYVGEFTRYRVRAAPGVMLGVKTANTHAAWRAKPGDPVRLRWAVTDAYLVPPAG
ncbi:MAG TPA: ABC transporter ATP-binding protein [Candidatus Methylomirabilis sp.]|nr:ABC transporter ATP-binding protein [Candidatus Methylomirabilis sp.]